MSRISCNLVVYCAASNYDRVCSLVGSRTNIKVIVCEFSDTEFYKKYYEQIKTLMSSKEYVETVKNKNAPEYFFPEYNLVNFNKVSFVVDSMNHFTSKYYGWIDFGFPPSNGVTRISAAWAERVTQNSKVFMLGMRIPSKDKLFNPSAYWSNEVDIQGSSFLGTKESINEMHSLIDKSISTSINIGCIDDDQTQYIMAYLLNPSNFNIVIANWFGHFS